METGPEAGESVLVAAVLDAAPSPVLVLDADLRIQYANPACCRILRSGSLSALRHRPLLDLVPALGATGFADGVRRAFAGQATAFEVHHALSDRWFAVTAAPLPGGLAAVHAVEFTEHQRRARELAAAKARLDAIINGSPGLVLAVDQELRILAFNDAYADAVRRIFGRRIERGMTLHDVLAGHDDQRADTIARWQRAAVGGEEFVLHREVADSDGELRTYEIRYGSLRDQDGALSGAVSVMLDVTGAMRDRAALHESEARFRALGEAAPIGIFLADAHGHCRYANPAFQQIWELRWEAIARDGVSSRVHPADLPLAHRWKGIGGDGTPFRGEFRLVLADGLERWVLAHSAPIRDEQGVITGYVGTVDDITEARRAGEAQRQLEQKMLHAQKLESLEVLAGGIAHDFNNLLVGILGNASLALLDVPRHSPAYGPITDIERAAERASDLTRQMLAYSGRGQFVVEPVDLSDLVGEMAALLRTVIARGAVLSMDLEPALPLIEADATQLRQIVMNLITNASDALGERGGDIRVRTGHEEVTDEHTITTWPGEVLPAGPYVYVEVADTGDGMRPETLARIFEPFFTTKFTGRGLGLAATLGIVRGHRGGVTIDTMPGRGSTFRILLPVSPMAAAPPLPQALSVAGRESGTVLVIDDDETVCTVARRLLERRGYTVTTATDGAAGVAQFVAAGAPVSLVLLDLTMPGMDGAATLRALRAHDQDVRVLVCSGYRERDVTAHFAGLHPAGFVQKPFRAEELYAAVSRALRTSGSAA